MLHLLPVFLLGCVKQAPPPATAVDGVAPLASPDPEQAVPLSMVPLHLPSGSTGRVDGWDPVPVGNVEARTNIPFYSGHGDYTFATAVQIDRDGRPISVQPGDLSDDVAQWRWEPWTGPPETRNVMVKLTVINFPRERGEAWPTWRITALDDGEGVPVEPPEPDPVDLDLLVRRGYPEAYHLVPEPPAPFDPFAHPWDSYRHANTLTAPIYTRREIRRSQGQPCQVRLRVAPNGTPTNVDLDGCPIDLREPMREAISKWSWGRSYCERGGSGQKVVLLFRTPGW